MKVEAIATALSSCRQGEFATGARGELRDDCSKNRAVGLFTIVKWLMSKHAGPFLKTKSVSSKQIEK